MHRSIIILGTLAAFTLASCTKVVQPDLQTSSPQYVIEASISNAEEGALVHITRSVGFNEPNSYPAVGNATVILADDLGHTDTLAQKAPGHYTAQRSGLPGHTYQLQVLVDGKTFSATATMPTHQAAIDSFYSLRESPFGEELITPYVRYHDPADSKEFYHFIVYKNGARSRLIYIAKDMFDDGQLNTQGLRDLDSTYKAGDRIMVEMQGISGEMYDYYYSLQQNLAQSSATPSNPVSMLKGDDVVGYFSAHSSQKRSIVVPAQ